MNIPFVPVLGSAIVICGLANGICAQDAPRNPFIIAPNTEAGAVKSTNPLASAELVALVRQLRSHPELKEMIVSEIRSRGIGFPLTNGMRSVVRTQSGNDASLLRTLEEAERRRAGVSASIPPSSTEALALLDRARVVALEQGQQMPDFIVKQQITRSRAFGTTKNWIPSDRLTVAVTYRVQVGEQYKLLAINGLPVPVESVERDNYEQAKGTSSTGEFASTLAALFAAESRTLFQPVDTDTLPQGRAIIYQYEVKRENSKQQLKVGTSGVSGAQAITVGARGRVWIDRESARVWRIENTATDITEGFPISAAMNRIEYDWAEIDDRQYLMPVRAELELTSIAGERLIQTRNDIRFRDYRKFGSKVEILDDDTEDPPPPSDSPQ